MSKTNLKDMKIGERRKLNQLGREVSCEEGGCNVCVYYNSFEPCANEFDESGHCFSSKREDEKEVCFKLCED